MSEQRSDFDIEDAICSFIRALNIIENEDDRIAGRPDAVFFRLVEEIALFEKIS
jgi:hypothetical protein